MIDFSTTTAFRLTRRLVMGQGTTALYLLIYEEGTQSAIETDLQAEVQVQMASPLPIGRVSERLDVDDVLESQNAGPIRALRIDRWSPELVPLLDTHVIRLERTGAQFCFSRLRTLVSDCSWRPRTFATALLTSFGLFRTILREALRVELGG